MKLKIDIGILAVSFSLLLGACLPQDNSVDTRRTRPVATIMEIPGATLPTLRSVDDRLYISWVDTISSAGQASLLFSSINDTIIQTPITLACGENWFINWADYPTVAVAGKKVLAHYLQNHSGAKSMAYDIKFGLQDLQGTAAEFRLLNTDGKAAEHGFVSMLPLTDGSFFVSWLDGRAMAGGEGGHHHSHSQGAMSVRVATINPQGAVSGEAVIDHRACTCCQTTTALTDQGPVVLYRDCSIDNIRDIVIARRIGEQWTEPRPIHLDGWKIEGCPVNGPKADAIGDALAVAWYTGAKGQPAVKVAFSEDAGETFIEPIVLSKELPLGRVDLQMLSNRQAVVSWMESEGDDTFLYAQKVDSNGQTGARVKVDQVSSARKSGFPQMEIQGDKLYFAWVDPAGSGSTIKIAYMPLDVL